MKTEVEKRHKSNQIVDDDRLAAVERTMEKLQYQDHSLVEVLMTAQEAYGSLSRQIMEYIAAQLDVPLVRVYSVATFYDLLRIDYPVTTECKVCNGPACKIAGSNEIISEIYRQIETTDDEGIAIDKQYDIQRVSCLGLCDHAPAALVNNKPQVNIAVEDVAFLLHGKAQLPDIRVSGNPRELTGPIGRLAPTDLVAHRSEGAFRGLEKALTKMTPDQVIAEVKDSGLSGRGGAGFPTGVKWEFTLKASEETKYVVCNFDESEPGTFKDRALMEGNPFRVLEGLAISAYATGAKKGYVFVRGEYSAASEIIEKAISELVSEGFLGANILGTDFEFNIEVRHNAGAYICGEETAQFEAIEGKRGNPRRKPPYPTQSGLFGKPTAINNVETLAVVPSLINHGGKWFRQWGTESSIGLKLFCLSGNINNPGVVEAPFGLTIREMIEKYGGGFDGEPQAILVGGAAGGFMSPEDIDTPLTHEDLKKIDVPIGSGAIMVFNQSVDMWQVLEGLAYFFVHESCGQCAPCRIGTNQIYHLVQKFNQGNGNSADLYKAGNLGKTIKRACVCGLGMTAANPIVTYIDHFSLID